MPFYNFACDTCGKRFEELVAYDRRREMKCPHCGGTTQVLVSTFASVSGSSSGSGAAAPAPRRFT